MSNRFSVRRLLLPGLLLLICSHVRAQDDYVVDNAGQTTGGLWTEVSTVKVLPYNLSFGIDAGFRTNEWFNEANRFDVGLGLDWKPTKHWKFGIGYTFLMKHYPAETAHKSVTEYEWKYRDTSTGDNVDFAEYMGAPTYTDAAGAYGAAGTAYRYRGFNEDVKDYTRLTEAFWRPRHRVSIDGAYTIKFWKVLRLTLRERYQLTFVPSKEVSRTRTGTKTTTKYRDPSYDADGNLIGDVLDAETYDEVEGPVVGDAGEETTKEKSSKTLHALRSRLTFEIDRKGWAVTPYAYAELFNDLGSAFHTDKVRASAGIEYALSKQHRLQLGYVFNHENDDDGDQNIHAISIGYRFKF